eukprot:352844-Lingulodinium_polyedra.AAC.1
MTPSLAQADNRRKSVQNVAEPSASSWRSSSKPSAGCPGTRRAQPAYAQGVQKGHRHRVVRT